jgi:hypothetical protein
MTESDEKQTGFLGTYFDRDMILRISRLAGIFAWVILSLYILFFVISFTQFMMQFAAGIYNQKGILLIDLISYFTPYFMQPLPGLVYFIGLKFAQHGLLVLLDIEDNTRRAARNK